MIDNLLFAILSAVLAACALAYGRERKKAAAQSSRDRRNQLRDEARRL